MSVQFKSLRCSELEGLGVRYLRADSSIDCDTAAYREFAGNVAWLLAFYLCIPLAYFFLLYRVSDRLHVPEESEAGEEGRQERLLREAALRLQEQTDPELRPLKFLYKGYRSQFW